MPDLAIDVIVPVYNGENFIERLIKTFEEQTFKDFKVIFVDDGSTDNSLNVLHEKLKTVTFENTIVHQENGGLPSARNTGIKNSDSPWITFVDCDDILDCHFLEYLFKSVSENDTVLGYCGYQFVPHNQQNKIAAAGNYDCEVISASDCMKAYYTNWVGACSLIINRKYLFSNDLFFDEKCTYCEDIPFITQVIEATGRVSKVNNNLYIYLLRQGSLIRNPKIEKYKVGLEGFLRMSAILEKKESDAAKVFSNVGKARYIIATLRKGAVQLPFKSFKALTDFIDVKMFRHQIKNLSLQQKIAGYLYTTSKVLFYYSIRLLFKD
ncbi:MAG: glycosyltransferase family 2 protein [Clostridia bacterium]|nr:glycosyltransferase family 2 protein [Clostridia bacterium]MBQ7289147.1 glycosyltransferase family 2 protein [Clostridia bacterium]